MRVMSAKDAKNPFGLLLLEAQKDAVTIERNGKPVADVRSYEDWQRIERMKLEWLRHAVAEADEAGETGDERVLDEAAIDVIVARARIPGTADR